MFFYFVRHGQTPGNQERRFQSPTTPLAAEGESQAAQLAERLQSYDLTEIWTSPLLRAKQTAEIINQYHHKPIRELDLLRELKRPTILENKLIDDPSIQHIQKQYAANAHNYEFKLEDGESFAEFVTRAKDFIAYAEKQATQYHDDTIIIVTAHGFIIKSILMQIVLAELATPAIINQTLKNMRIENTGISIARYAQTKAKWDVLTISDFSHL